MIRATAILVLLALLLYICWPFVLHLMLALYSLASSAVGAVLAAVIAAIAYFALAHDPGYTNGQAYGFRGPEPLTQWVREAHPIEKRLRRGMRRYR